MGAETSIRLVGPHEIRVILGGVSRQRVYQLTSRADFPAPVAELALGKVWAAADVEAWNQTRRYAGTPRLVGIGANVLPADDVIGGQGAAATPAAPAAALRP